MSVADFAALRVTRTAGRVQGAVTRCTLDELSPGDVVIRAEWSAVNYKDALAATGRGRLIRDFPRIAGIDVAGTVYSAPSGGELRPGQPVLVTGYDLGTGHDGGYAEYVRVPAAWVVPLPAGLDTRTAMLLGTAGFTVALCLRRMRDNGQTPEQGVIAVSGASGGVGMIAVAVLAHLGYTVHAISGKPEMHDTLRLLGATEVIAPEALCGSGQPLRNARWGGAIDNVGGELLPALLAATAPWGNVVSVGLAAAATWQSTVMPFILRGVSLLGVSSANCPPAWRRPLWQNLVRDLPPAFLARMPQREVELQQLPEVFSAMLQRHSSGRTLVRLAAPPEN